MPHLDRHGVRIYYEVRGVGPPVLLLNHGFAGTARTWEPNVAALSSRCRVITWDMRGHGRSDSPEDPAEYSEGAAAADMYALLDAAGADRVVVGGHSFGGYMSLVFALLHRERTDALILVATGPGYRSDDQRAGWNEMVETMAGRLDDHGLDGLWKADEVDRETHVSAEGLARALRGMVVQHDARVFESLPNIPAPTLIVVGERDERFRGAADYMERKIPGARKVVLNGAGHAANIHQAEAFNSAVLAFLECLT